ncbi:MAG: putative DNA-binding domain-containing protein [Rhodocyclales bacterium]|nr:putative DNA-binding domain-containing protein [Rhodocyclales bacterium]
MSADFAAALLATDGRCPPGLTCWNGSAPEKRFAVYRNNVVVGLVDALADSFPVTQTLVGEDFFRAMAREFVRRTPPRSPVLALYGEGFAEFVEGFPPAAGLPYLADVARLELLRVRSFHAADARPVTQQHLDRLLADQAALPQARFALHPALFVLTSAHAVVSLWAAHQSESAALQLAGLDTTQAEAALVCRHQLEVGIYRIGPGAAGFITALQQDANLSAAAEQALTTDADVDLTATLGLLLQAGAIVGITHPRRTHP